MPIDTTPSTVATNALQGIPFDSLIGGPLSAAVNAQSQAAMTTWEFIKNVGLTGPADNRKTVNVDFIYYVNGREAKLVVPLLTIVPIPYIAVNEIAIDFKASINASASNYQETATQEETKAGGSAEVGFGWGPVSGKANFNASYSSKKDSKSTQESKYSVEYTMDVHVRAGQDSMPAGLAKVLNILESSITPTQAKPHLVISPNPLNAGDRSQEQKLKVTVTAFDDKGMRVQGVTIKPEVTDPAQNTNQITFEPVDGTTDENGSIDFVVKIPALSSQTPQIAQNISLNFTATKKEGDKNAFKATAKVALLLPEYVPSAATTAA